MGKKQVKMEQFEINRILEERRNVLLKVIDFITKELSKLPEGSIIAARGKSLNQFRYYIKNTSDTEELKNSRSIDSKVEVSAIGKRSYLNHKNDKLKTALAQKKYYEQLLRKTQSELKKINQMINQNHTDSILTTYLELNPGIKRLVNPIMVDDETFVDAWERVEYTGKGFAEDDETQHYSEKNERMRSKSEVSIANALKKHNIPYRYEYPFVLKDGKTVYPDFTILLVKHRKIVYWEHLGKMGDIDYVTSNLRKINDYKAMGMFPGTEIIYTYETGSMSLGTTEINETIKRYLL